MRVSHEAIYQSLYVQGRGALRRELTACLRTGRALRVPRATTTRRNRSFVTDELLISERPAEVDDRAVAGHLEGGLILGLDRSAIGTLVERSSRFTMLLHLPLMAGHDSPRTKSSPALTGAGAAAVRDAIADTITTLPEQLRRSLTWDQGIEMAQHVQLRLERMLQEAGIGEPEDLERARTEGGGLGAFIRSLVGLDRRAATDALAEFIRGKTLSAAQHDFVALVIEHLTANGVMDAALLYEPPFTSLATGGPETLFNDADVEALIDVIRTVNDNTRAQGEAA
jgi:hypothetical protein